MPFIEVCHLPEKAMDTLFSNVTQALMFHATFDTAASSIGEEGHGIKVNVFTERPEWNIITFIGNIGGQMGLLVGFSFLGSIGWMLDMGQRIWQRVSVKL